MSGTITRGDIIQKLKLPSREIRILGVLAFDFDWNEFKHEWYEQINRGDLIVEIIRESEDLIYNHSIIASDRRISNEARSYELGNFMNIHKAPATILRGYLLEKDCPYLEPKEDFLDKQMKQAKALREAQSTLLDEAEKRKNENALKLIEEAIKRDDYRQRFILRTCYLHIPIPAIQIDNEFYVSLTLTKFNTAERFEHIEKDHLWSKEFSNYFKMFFNTDLSLKDSTQVGNENSAAYKFSTEMTTKGNREEVIQVYNENRVPMGLLPRDSFLNTKQVKLVVWALIFDRQGRLLLHKRKENAKDNRDMWDKSVGGHVDVNDIDTVKAVARELAEELFSIEAEGQGSHGKSDFLKPNVDKMIFLGEWLPNRRYELPFEDANKKTDEYYYFRMDYSFSSTARNSERHLPDGTVQDVLVFADVYVCVAAQSFDTSNLKNSEYLLLDLHEIKDAFNDKSITVCEENKQTGTLEEKKMAFNVTPDLKSIIMTGLWDELSSFSDALAKYGKQHVKNFK